MHVRSQEPLTIKLWPSDTARHVTVSVCPYKGCGKQQNNCQKVCICKFVLTQIHPRYSHIKADWPVWVSCDRACPCWLLRPTHRPQCWFPQWWQLTGWGKRHTVSHPSHTKSRSLRCSGDEHTQPVWIYSDIMVIPVRLIIFYYYNLGILWNLVLWDKEPSVCCITLNAKINGEKKIFFSFFKLSKDSLNITDWNIIKLIIFNQIIKCNYR